MARQEKTTMRKHISCRNKTHGGLGKRKAEQGRFFCFDSTRTNIKPFRFTYFYSKEIVGIDSS